MIGRDGVSKFLVGCDRVSNVLIPFHTLSKILIPYHTLSNLLCFFFLLFDFYNLVHVFHSALHPWNITNFFVPFQLFLPSQQSKCSILERKLTRRTQRTLTLLNSNMRRFFLSKKLKIQISVLFFSTKIFVRI